jgi:hypothetical protein
VKQLFEVANFVWRLRTEMRFGELAHSPLRLLRFSLQEDTAECDWLARPAESWDESLPRQIRERNASMQALQDAVAIREMIFGLLPEVRTVELRAFRQSAREPPRLLISGTVVRQEADVMKVTSPVMRAKLHGFRFWLDDGVLVTLQPEDRAVSNF